MEFCPSDEAKRVYAPRLQAIVRNIEEKWAAVLEYPSDATCDALYEAVCILSVKNWLPVRPITAERRALIRELEAWGMKAFEAARPNGGTVPGFSWV